ncbi:hydrogen peroxide-dependent heme synthase [Corynebacterium mendelii]|uniref:Coproheme decarboxylase n=1 Tax=Corynebacterium mendelii TaxID=2765362 RepID=A0A939IX68_9CORY|nr:chlorite dismutase family protein [Corynebacterium mendelii]
MADQKNIEALNQVQRYTQWISFTVDDKALRDGDVDAAMAEAKEFFSSFATIDPEVIDDSTGTPHLPPETVVRGVYDTSSIREGSDFLIWWHAKELESIQESFHAFKRTALGRASTVAWSGTGVHHPSEFNKEHLPTFIRGEEGGDWMTVYPFVRSYDWYLLDTNDRRRILLEHGQMGRKYPDVKANTVYAFALGDYEWMLAFECDDMSRIMELMHSMRYTEARLHVRNELPFHSGKRICPAELVDKLSCRGK